MGLFDRLFNSDKKILANIEAETKPILDYENEMASLTDEQLKVKTAEFKERRYKVWSFRSSKRSS